MTAGSDALECRLLQLKCDLVGGQDHAHSFRTPEIAKMLHTVYKGSCIGQYALRRFEETFHRRFAALALNVHALRH
jgi:hypothetical protein